jgi:hypothetical protein
MDVILDVLTEQVIAIDVIQEPAIDITVVTGSSGTDGVGVIPGGTTGQVLAKASNANYDTVWEDPAAGTVASVNGESGIVTLTQDDIPDGTTAKQYTSTEKTKLAGIAAGAQVNTVTSVAGKTGAVSLAKADVGLGNVDNTADTAKPVSTAQQTALDGKANTSHTHAESDVTGLVADLAGKAATVHTHAQADVTGLTALLALGFYYADGSTSTNARPSVPGKVLWVGGTTQPVNMATGDLWIKA